MVATPRAGDTDKVWGPQIFLRVPLVGGRFNVLLGPTDDSGTTRPIAQAFSGDAAFIGIKVADPPAEAGAPPAFGPEFAPRLQFTSVPYAVRAINSETADLGGILAELEARVAALEGGGTAAVLSPRVVRTRGAGETRKQGEGGN